MAEFGNEEADGSGRRGGWIRLEHAASLFEYDEYDGGGPGEPTCNCDRVATAAGLDGSSSRYFGFESCSHSERAGGLCSGESWCFVHDFAAIRPTRAVDPVADAQRFIYGKGVRQDCDRGMRILKPEADRSNPKAMIEMGALYSAGLCTPRDLPTAYRWFAMALRKDPDNQSVQTDLRKLWGEMTQPERQLAIRLSQ